MQLACLSANIGWRQVSRTAQERLEVLSRLPWGRVDDVAYLSRDTVTPTEYLLLAAVALIVAGFVAVLVWNLWLTPAEHARIKAAASKD
jgi:hypothetical protein